MAQIVFIDHADDPRLDPYRALKARDAVTRRHGFIAEGELVVARALQAGRYPLDSIFIAEPRLARMAALADRLETAGTSVYAARQDVMDAVCGLHLHRGVLAFGRSPVPTGVESLLDALPHRATLVVLVGLGDTENMGSVFRNAAALGADAVLLDATCCDPLYRRAIRVSVGAALIVPFARLAAGDDLLATLTRHGFEALAFTPAGETPLQQVAPAERTALLFGAEGPGLPPILLTAARTVSIPMAGGFDSLNVATTTGIALHHVVQAMPSVEPDA